MNTSRIDATLAQLTDDEIADGLWIIDVCERSGTMSRTVADEWRRRIRARQAWLELEADRRPVS